LFGCVLLCWLSLVLSRASFPLPASLIPLSHRRGKKRCGKTSRWRHFRPDTETTNPTLLRYSAVRRGRRSPANAFNEAKWRLFASPEALGARRPKGMRARGNSNNEDSECTLCGVCSAW
jgi:hypothetical protein